MLTAGKSDHEHGSTAVTEVFDASDPTKASESLMPFPNAEVWLPPGGFLDGKLVVCSGSSSKMCYTFDGCSWTPFATLMDQRHQSASSVIKGTPDRLWLVGGNGGTSKKTSEYLFSNGTVSPGPNMHPGPFDYYGVYGSCVVQLVNGQSLLLGGSGSSGLVRTKVLRYDHITDTFTEQQPMLYYRYFHACTVFVSAKHGK